MLEFRKDWKDLAFVGMYNLLNGRFLEHLPTKVLHLNVPVMMSVPEFSSKMMKNFKKTGLLQEGMTYSTAAFYSICQQNSYI